MESTEYNNFSNILVITAFCSLAFYFAKSCYWHWRLLTMTRNFKEPQPSSFLFGNLDLLGLSTDQLYKRMRLYAKEHYPHFRLRVLYKFSISIVAPEDCEIFMGGKKHSTKSELYNVLLRNWLKDGLLMSTGEKWTQRRKILTPAFHFNILKNFVNIFNEETEELLETILQQHSKPIDVVPLCSEFTLAAVNETAMGYKVDPKNKDQTQYREAIQDIDEILVFKSLRPWLYKPWVYFFTPTYRKEWGLLKILHSFTRNIIKERMNSFEGISGFEDKLNNEENNENNIYMNTKRKRLAMLDVLLQAKQDGEQIDYDGICEEVDTFMFEGHDTTSAALSFCLMLIANHPKIQEQIYQEIKSILGKNIKKPTYNDLQAMSLLERCIKESLRLYPSVPLISRIADEDTTLHSGLIVPKDTTVHICILDLHRNPKFYPDPEKFDPDRFLLENCQDRHPFAFIPFSGGPRNCIGQKFAVLEMKSLLSGILQRFKMTAVDTPDDIVLKTELLLRSKNGIKINFIPRVEEQA